MKPAADAGGDANVSAFLFPFGFGLSYTQFKYSNLKINTADYLTKGEVTVTATIKNTGKIKGAEIVELYINDQVSSVTTYVLKLRGFERILLLPNEEKQVTFVLRANDFSLLNWEMKRVKEPSWFKIMVGASSEEIRLKDRILL